MASVAKRKWTYNGVSKEGWEVRYFDEKGIRRSKTLPLKKDAEAFKRKVEREMHGGDHIADADTRTVADVCLEYLRQAEQRTQDGRIGASRLTILRYSFETCTLPVLGRKLIRDLRESDLELLYQGFVADGRMKPTSARNRLQDMKLIEAFAQKRGYLKTQPVTVALRELRGIRREPIRTFTPEQVQGILSVAAERFHRRHHRATAWLECYIHLAAFCGLRRGEIAGLTLGNVDLEHRVLLVRHNLTAQMQLKGPKTRAGVRDVPMPRHVAEMVRSWIAKHHVANDRNLVFTGPTGAPQTLGVLHALWLELLERAGLERATGQEHFHFHALRHFYASMMIESGAPLPDVAKLLGHSAFDMTLQVYTHSVLKPQHRHELVDNMASRLTLLAPSSAPAAREPQPAT